MVKDIWLLRHEPMLGKNRCTFEGCTSIACCIEALLLDSYFLMYREAIDWHFTLFNISTSPRPPLSFHYTTTKTSPTTQQLLPNSLHSPSNTFSTPSPPPAEPHSLYWCRTVHFPVNSDDRKVSTPQPLPDQ